MLHTTDRMPFHVGIIMDGNGRWAVERGMPRSFGHRQGARTVRDIVEAAPDCGITELTLYAFSTENWKRPHYEIRFLMRLFHDEIIRQSESLLENGVRVRFIGERCRLPPVLVARMEEVEGATRANARLTLQVAINYGGRWDLVTAVRALGQEIAAGRLNPDLVSEHDIATRLSTVEVRDPDLIIRTSGEMRLSNFLLWQSAYTEFSFVEKHWPDFTRDDLLDIVHKVKVRERRYGSVGAASGSGKVT